MMRYSKIFLFLLSAALISAFTAAASRAAISDDEFINKIISSNLLEFNLGKMAKARADSVDVKEYASVMVNNYAPDDLGIMLVAKRSNVQAPEGRDMDRQDQLEVQWLSDFEGPRFDKAYLDVMVSNHEEKLRLFENVAESSKNPHLRNYAQNTIPTILEQLRWAEEIREIQG